jgi:hypothetical protein
LMVRVPWHRASWEAVALGECPCSFLEACACTPEAPATRKTTHPIRKATTKAISCPWRITPHPPSLCMHPLLLAPPSMPHDELWRISTEAYSPKCVEGEFSEVQLPLYGVLRSSLPRNSHVGDASSVASIHTTPVVQHGGADEPRSSLSSTGVLCGQERGDNGTVDLATYNRYTSHAE